MKYGVGIDVSKGKSTVSIMKVDGEIVEMPFEINHDINGFEMLEQKIKDISIFYFFYILSSKVNVPSIGKFS